VFDSYRFVKVKYAHEKHDMGTRIFLQGVEHLKSQRSVRTTAELGYGRDVETCIYDKCVHSILQFNYLRDP